MGGGVGGAVMKQGQAAGQCCLVQQLARTPADPFPCESSRCPCTVHARVHKRQHRPHQQELPCCISSSPKKGAMVTSAPVLPTTSFACGCCCLSSSRRDSVSGRYHADRGPGRASSWGARLRSSGGKIGSTAAGGGGTGLERQGNGLLDGASASLAQTGAAAEGCGSESTGGCSPRASAEPCGGGAAHLLGACG
jgi:hypothetical protein